MATSSRTQQRPVLLVAPQPVYQDRGTPIAVRYVVTALSEQGWHVDLLTYPIGEDIELPRVRIFRFGKWLRFKSVSIGLSPKKLLLDIVMIFAMWTRVRKRDYACIHAVEEAIYPALLIGRINRVPVIYDMQSSLAEGLAVVPVFRLFFLRKFLDWCERVAFRNAALVVCSIGLARKIRDEARTVVTYEWVFPRGWNAGEERERTVLRRQLGIPESAKVVIYTGNFESYQGIPVLLDSVSLVTRECPEAVFLLVGADAASLRAISSRYREPVLQGRLVVLERQSRRRALELLHMADVAVSPRPRGSNLPLKVFDYLVAGLPVVATDIEAHRPLDGKGVMLTKTTPEHFARGIVELLTDTRLWRTYRVRAQKVGAAELSWAVFRDQVTCIYEKAVNADSDGREDAGIEVDTSKE